MNDLIIFDFVKLDANVEATKCYRMLKVTDLDFEGFYAFRVESSGCESKVC